MGSRVVADMCRRFCQKVDGTTDGKGCKGWNGLGRAHSVHKSRERVLGGVDVSYARLERRFAWWLGGGGGPFCLAVWAAALPQVWVSRRGKRAVTRAWPWKALSAQFKIYCVSTPVWQHYSNNNNNQPTNNNMKGYVKYAWYLMVFQLTPPERAPSRTRTHTPASTSPSAPSRPPQSIIASCSSASTNPMSTRTKLRTATTLRPAMMLMVCRLPARQTAALPSSTVWRRSAPTWARR